MRNLFVLITLISVSFSAFAFEDLLAERATIIKKIKNHNLRGKLISKKNELKRSQWELQKKVYGNQLSLVDSKIIYGEESEEYKKLVSDQEDNFKEFASELLKISEESVNEIVNIDDVSKVEVCENCLGQEHDELEEQGKVSMAEKISVLSCGNSGFFPKRSFRVPLYKIVQSTQSISQVDASEIPYSPSMKVAASDDGSLLFVEGKGSSKVEYLSLCTIYQRKKHGVKMKTDDQLIRLHYTTLPSSKNEFDAMVSITTLNESKKGNMTAKRLNNMNKRFKAIDL